MVIAGFICTLVVALIMGGFFVAFDRSTKFLAFTSKLLAPLASLILALACANLSSALGGYTIFIVVGIAFVLAKEVFLCAKKAEDNNENILFVGIINAVSSLCFAVGGIFLARFNIFGLLLGLFLGLGLACILLTVKRLNLASSLMLGANLAIAGMILGQAITLLLAKVSLITTIFYLLSGVMMLTSQIVNLFVKQEVALKYVKRVTQILSLILLSASIFFL